MTRTRNAADAAYDAADGDARPVPAPTPRTPRPHRMAPRGCNGRWNGRRVLDSIALDRIVVRAKAAPAPDGVDRAPAVRLLDPTPSRAARRRDRAPKPLLVEAMVSEKLHDSVNVALLERFASGRSARTATHHLTRRRWEAFYLPMYEQWCTALGVPFRVTLQTRKQSG